MFYRFAYIVLTTILLILLPVHAMLEAEECPRVVQEALTQVGDNCSDLSKNSVCYGFNRVEATFSQSVAEDFFSRPADKAEISTLDSINTAPLDGGLNQWGVAVMSIQANVPNSLPGQSVRFLLLGDVNIENAVPADQALPSVEPIKVVTLVSANVRTRPSTNSNILGSVPAGTELPADGLSADGNWLRVVIHDVTPGWLNRQLIDTTTDVSGLPTITAESQSPMQAFYFRTGIGQPSCNESPSVLVVQGPEKLKVNITVNGVGIEIGSTIALRTVKEDEIQLMTIHGSAKTGNLTIPGGFTATAQLDQDRQAGHFGGLSPMTQDELDSLRWLNDIPDKVLNYPIEVPQHPQTLPTPIPSNTSTSNSLPHAPSGVVDCGPFRATSPLDGLHFGLNTFYWDPAPGATSYRLNVPGVGSTEIPASNTSVNFDLSPAGENYQMSWSVDALYNGAVACSTPLVTIPREAAPNITASWSCGPGYDHFTITYANLPPGSTSVVFNFNGSATPASGYMISSPPSSGSQGFDGTDVYSGGSVTAFPTGKTATLSPASISCTLG